MITKRFVLVLVFAWISLATVGARIFDTEQQYIKLYGANVNKGVPAPPPYKFAIYRKKQVRVLVLFNNQISLGEVVSKPKSRLMDADVPGILAANQGSSIWQKQNVETTKDPKAPKMSLWQRKDGKLFAGYFSNIPVPCLLIGTKSGGDFLMKEKDKITSYVKD